MNQTLSKNIIRQFTAQIVGVITGLGSSIITSRILGPDGRGNFAILINSASFLSLILGFSFGSAVVHIVSANKAPVRNLVNTILLGILILVIVCFFVLLIFLSFDSFNFLFPSSQSLSFNLIAFLMLFSTMMCSILFNSIISGKKLFFQQQVNYFWIAGISLVLYLLFYYLNNNSQISFKSFIYFYLIINTLPLIGIYYIYVKYARPTFNFKLLDKIQFKYLANFSFLAYLANILQFLSYRMDFWFVKYYFGNNDLGIYSLAVNLAQMLWLLPQAVASVFLSYSSSEQPEVLINQTNVLSRINFFIMLVATIILTSSIGFIIPLLYGKQFTNAVFLFRVLLIGIVPFSITTILASYFAGRGMQKVNLQCSLIGFVICLMFDLILIPKYGPKGAAYATILSYTISTSYIIFIYLKHSKSNLIELLMVRKEDILFLQKKLKL